MSVKKSPLARQKDEFGNKEKLVDRVLGLLGQIGTAGKGEGDKDELKARLLAASNKKLIRLFEISTEIKEKYGSVDKLADATAKALGRAKDVPYVSKLRTLTPGRLLDLLHAAQKRETRGGKAA